MNIPLKWLTLEKYDTYNYLSAPCICKTVHLTALHPGARTIRPRFFCTVLLPLELAHP